MQVTQEAEPFRKITIVLESEKEAKVVLEIVNDYLISSQWKHCAEFAKCLDRQIRNCGIRRDV